MALSVAMGDNPTESISRPHNILNFGDEDSETPGAFSGRISAPTISLRGNSSSPLAPSRPANPTQPDAHNDAYNYLIGKGLSPIAASGIIGNLTHESGLNPASLNPNDKGKPAYGLAQWRGDRLDALNNWAKKNGRSASDMSSQLDYLIKEAGDRGDLQAVNKANTPEEAALIFGRKFERPQESTANWAKRQQYARNAYRPN